MQTIKSLLQLLQINKKSIQIKHLIASQTPTQNDKSALNDRKYPLGP